MNRIDLDSSTAAAPCASPPSWSRAALRRSADLADLEQVAARYAVAVTPAMAALIDPDDPARSDRAPVRSRAPRTRCRARRESPIRSAIDAHSPVEGIVHRYPDRVLLKLVHVCAVYCRFCFRREMVGPGKATALSPRRYDDALAYIRAHPEIWEVILTGGDPLMLSPRRLAEIMSGSGRHRPREGHAHPHPRAGRRARSASRDETGRGAEGRGRRRPRSRCTPIIRAN